MNRKKCSKLLAKGLSLAEDKNYSEAILAWDNAEQCMDGKYPAASFNKGLAYDDLEQYDWAVESFTKAELDSKDGNFPGATLGKGVVYIKLGQYDRAIESFTKAERDSEDGKCPTASHNKGNAYQTLAQYDPAIESFTKAERDSKDGKFPGATYGKGDVYIKLGQYDRAVESFTKAELDSKDGKFPGATLGKGVVYIKLEQYDRAIESFTKAERDSEDGKSPGASYDKGTAYNYSGEYDRAIESYTKAERDSKNGKYPNASLNKGVTYYKLGDYDRAIESCNKAVHDRHPDVYFLEHHYLSLSYDFNHNYNKAKKHAFIALKHADRDIEVVDNICQRYSTPYTIQIYRQRKQYVHTLLSLSVDRYFNDKWTRLDAADTHDPLLDKDHDINEGFHRILTNRDLEMPNSMGYKQRLRTSYLLHYLSGNFYKCFHLLDSLFDDIYAHGPIDAYFYSITAYLIGEPISELQILLRNHEDSSHWSNGAHQQWNDNLRSAIESNKLLDPYLLEIALPKKILSEGEIPTNYHPWVYKLLEKINEGKTNYDIPLSDTIIKGIEAKHFKNLYVSKKAFVRDDNEKWDIIKKEISAMVNGDESVFNFAIARIRDAIRNEVPYSIILLKLMGAYSYMDSDSEKKAVAILMATVLASETIDNKNTFPDHSRLLMDTISALGIEGLLFFMNITYFGLGTAIGFLVSVTKKIVGQEKEKRSEKIFQNLKKELDNRSPLI